MREGCVTLLFLVVIALVGAAIAILVVNSPVRDALADAIYVVALGLAAALVLGALALVVYVATRLILALRGVVEIRPGPDGQPPALRMRFRNGVTVVHQLDRTPSPVTIFDAHGRPYFAFPEERVELQAQALRGAQQVQAVRAAVSGERSVLRSLRDVVDATAEAPPMRRIGQVRTIDPEDVDFDVEDEE